MELINIKHKKALSPVITTVLLVLLAIVLALIIFLWASSFLKEGLTKNSQPIERACDDVKFDVSSSGNQLSITNNGMVPIYKFQIITTSAGTSNSIDLNQAIGVGQSKSFDQTVSSGSKIVPVLLGTSKNNEINEFPCPKANWKVIE